VGAFGVALLCAGLWAGCGDDTMGNSDGGDGGNADLKGADLKGVDLKGADLAGADLAGADLAGVDLFGVDMTLVPTVDPTMATAAGTFSSPLDAVLTPDGTTVYVSGYNAAGEAAIFSLTVSSGTSQTLVSGNGLVFPASLALSNDGKTLYVADT